MLTETKQAILEHAKNCYPRESCGLVIIRKGRERYYACTNIAGSGEFCIDPIEYAQAEDEGAITHVVHSHPKSKPHPSEADLIGCEKSGLPWVIVNPLTEEFYQFEPSGYEPPLIGRQFYHNVQDCYTFIQDYYKHNLGIVLPEFPRTENWWLAGDDMYIDGYPEAGFSVVPQSEIQPHDVILMKVAAPVVNHGAVYVGNNRIQHHQVDRLSSEDVYGGWYQKITQLVIRHKDLA